MKCVGFVYEWHQRLEHETAPSLLEQRAHRVEIETQPFNVLLLCRVLCLRITNLYIFVNVCRRCFECDKIYTMFGLCQEYKKKVFSCANDISHMMGFVNNIFSFVFTRIRNENFMWFKDLYLCLPAFKNIQMMPFALPTTFINFYFFFYFSEKLRCPSSAAKCSQITIGKFLCFFFQIGLK